jgi:hypothetical protein
MFVGAPVSSYAPIANAATIKVDLRERGLQERILNGSVEKWSDTHGHA